ncbi:MAG TPA: type IV secretory system conjugative DNA transfer family protein, partial [Pirellulales bacterium]
MAGAISIADLKASRRHKGRLLQRNSKMSTLLNECPGALLGWSRPARDGVGFHCETPFGRREMVCSPAEGHTLTFAPTGAGKGRNVLIPNLVANPRSSIVCIDVKGELYRTTAPRRRAMGQTVWRLDPFNVCGPESDSLNVLDVFDLGGDVETLAQMQAELLSVGNRGVKDPFWDVSASGLIAGILVYVALQAARVDRSLRKVRDLLMSDDVVYSLAVLLDTVGKEMNLMARQEIAAFLQMPERDTRGGVL